MDNNASSMGEKSCVNLVEYLKKENQITVPGNDSQKLVNYYKKEGDQFFNSTRDNISGDQVIEEIDGNAAGKGLKDSEARFFNLFINPSQSELKAIGDDHEKLTQYTRDLMKEYANQFNRNKKNGEKITVDDLVWYGKVERNRYFTKDDEKVKHNEKYVAISNEIRKAPSIEAAAPLIEKLKQMGEGVFIHDEKTKEIKIVPYPAVAKGKKMIRRRMQKPEEYQSHVHVIISRMAKTEERISLSPMAKAKNVKTQLNGKTVTGGFNRSDFAKKTEMLFDLKFGHARTIEESYVYKNDMKNGHKQKENTVVPGQQKSNQVPFSTAKTAKTEERVFLSPIAEAKSVTTQLNGKTVSGGFNRVPFAQKAEVPFKEKREKNTVGMSKTPAPYETPIFSDMLFANMMRQADKNKMGVNQNAVILHKKEDPNFKAAIDNILKDYGIKAADNFPELLKGIFDKKVDFLYDMKFMEAFDINKITNMIPQKMAVKATQLVVKQFTQSI